MSAWSSGVPLISVSNGRQILTAILFKPSLESHLLMRFVSPDLVVQNIHVIWPVIFHLYQVAGSNREARRKDLIKLLIFKCIPPTKLLHTIQKVDITARRLRWIRQWARLSLLSLLRNY